MVAFATEYAPKIEAPDAHGARQRVDGAPKACPKGGPNRVPSGRVGPQNRARGIFLAVEVRAGENGARSRFPRREKAGLSYETASGPTNFLNRDPIEEQGGVNLYVFVVNDPLNRIDILGLKDCYEVSFSVSFRIESKDVRLGWFGKAGVAGRVNIEVKGQVCEECCDGEKTETYTIGAKASGDATLFASGGIDKKVEYDGFNIDVLAGIRGYGGAEVSGGGYFTKDCDGSGGKGEGRVGGTIGIEAGGRATFVFRNWFEIGETGVTGSGTVTGGLPFSFTCDPEGCDAPSFGDLEAGGEVTLEACLLGLCIGPTWEF